MVMIEWKEPLYAGDSITKYRVCISDMCHNTADSTTVFTISTSEFVICDSYNISIIPCLPLPGCVESRASDSYGYIFAEESKLCMVINHSF